MKKILTLTVLATALFFASDVAYATDDINLDEALAFPLVDAGDPCNILFSSAWVRRGVTNTSQVSINRIRRDVYAQLECGCGKPLCDCMTSGPNPVRKNCPPKDVPQTEVHAEKSSNWELQFGPASVGGGSAEVITTVIPPVRLTSSCPGVKKSILYVNRKKMKSVTPVAVGVCDAPGLAVTGTWKALSNDTWSAYSYSYRHEFEGPYPETKPCPK